MICITSLLVLLVFSAKNIAAEDEKESEIVHDNPLSHGFGDDIEWVEWDDAVEKAKKVNKPIFLLIHKTWCGACKNLKSSFQAVVAQKTFLSLSKNFVMVNTEDDDEPSEEMYKPDGQYIPRILFLDKNGEVLTGIRNANPAFETYKHYYSNPEEVFTAMKSVIKLYGEREKKKTDKNNEL